MSHVPQTASPAETESPVLPSPRLTVNEVRKIYRKKARTIRDWAAAGKIPGALKIGRDWTFDRDLLPGCKPA